MCSSLVHPLRQESVGTPGRVYECAHHVAMLVDPEHACRPSASDIHATKGLSVVLETVNNSGTVREVTHDNAGRIDVPGGCGSAARNFECRESSSVDHVGL